MAARIASGSPSAMVIASFLPSLPKVLVSESSKAAAASSSVP
jgi:hypothetical protein